MRTVGADFQMFTLTWFTVIVFSLFFGLTAGDLQVLYGTTDVTNRVLVNESDAHLPDFDDLSLPSALKGDSVGKPSSLSVSLYYEQHNSTIYQGATFEWTLPSSETSRLSLKGFYVEIDGKSSPDRYRLYILNNVEFGTKSLTFRMNMTNFSRTTDDFTVRVYSMPADQRHRNNTETFEYLYLRTVISNDIYFYPSEWSPTVAYKPFSDAKSVDINFSLPPKGHDWLLTQFRVMLLSCPEHLVIKDRSTTEAFLTFTGLESEVSYSIVVEVKNYNQSLCICRTKFDKCDTSCGFTQTKEFSLPGNRHLSEPSLSRGCEFTQTTVAYTSPPKATSDVTTQNATTKRNAITTRNASSDKDDSKTVVIVTVTLTLLLVVVLASLVIARRYCKKGKNNDQPTENLALPKAEIAEIPVEVKVKELQRKTVYIVAASDHSEDDELIKSFCAFLKAHCQCDAINPSNANLRQTHESAWVTSKMSSSDCIIFVNSRGAAKLLDVYLKCIESDSEPPQSMSIKALQFSFNLNLRSKFMTVTFNQDWIRDKLAVLNPKKYHLPKQLPHFLRGIHNLSEREAESYEGQLPLNLKYLENLPEWQPLLEAIREVENFEKNIKPLTETDDDNTSSFHSTGLLKGPLSVSMTDVTIDTDIPEHPSANLPYSESLKCPDNGNEVDLHRTINPEFSSTPFGPSDGLSCFTIGKGSDFQNIVSQEPSQSAHSDNQIAADLRPSPNATNYNPNQGNVYEASQDVYQADRPPESKQTFPDRNLRPKVSTSASPHQIKPPQVNINLPCDDSMSNVLSRLNDNVSVWSNQPGNGRTIDQTSAPQIKPPRVNTNLPCDDSMSNVLSRLNDNVSVWSNQPGNGRTIDQTSPPQIKPPRVNTNLPCDDSMSDVLSRLNDTVSVWSNQPANGRTIGQKESRDESDSEEPSGSVNHNRSTIRKPPPTVKPADYKSARVQEALNEEDNSKCLRKLTLEFQENHVDEISV